MIDGTGRKHEGFERCLGNKPGFCEGVGGERSGHNDRTERIILAHSHNYTYFS